MTNLDKLTIRRIEQKEISVLTDYRIAYLSEMQGQMNDEYRQKLHAELQEYFSRTIEKGSFFALRADIEGEIVAFGAMIIKEIPGDRNRSFYLEGEILNMYTVPIFRRKGISSMILQKLLDEARSMGISKVALHCSKDGEPLYRKFGFSDPVYPYLELGLNT